MGSNDNDVAKFIARLHTLENRDDLFDNPKDREIFDKLHGSANMEDLIGYSLQELNHLNISLTKIGEIEETVSQEELRDILKCVPSSIPTNMVLI